MYTDGSALGNPGPTGAGAAIYLNGAPQDPITACRPVSSCSTSYHGELQAIDLVITELLAITPPINRPVHPLAYCACAGLNGRVLNGRRNICPLMHNLDSMINKQAFILCLNTSGKHTWTLFRKYIFKRHDILVIYYCIVLARMPTCEPLSLGISSDKQL